jgi:hypothetical protein
LVVACRLEETADMGLTGATYAFVYEFVWMCY